MKTLFERNPVVQEILLAALVEIVPKFKARDIKLDSWAQDEIASCLSAAIAIAYKEGMKEAVSQGNTYLAKKYDKTHFMARSIFKY